MAENNTVVIGSPEELGRVETRRSFLRALGLGGSIVLLPAVFAACGDDNQGVLNPPAAGSGAGVRLDLSTDAGILNYAYALEQLEAAFYTAVIAAPAFAGLPAGEREILGDLQKHEVIHRDFLKAALAANAIGSLSVNFGTALASRTSILANAQAFEDLGVAAYNGAGKYIRDAGFLLLAGKIVSVEARHAATIRDAIDFGAGGSSTGTAFADLASLAALGASATSALDGALEPSAVLDRVRATGTVTTPITIGTQPAALA